MKIDEQVVVIGASGFGRECLEVLDSMNRSGAGLEVLGVVDDSPSPANLGRLEHRKVEYLGTLSEWLCRRSDAKYVLGIGDPHVRQRLVARLNSIGAKPQTIIHPDASVGSMTNIAPGVVICSGAIISTNVSLGEFVHINPNVTIGHDATISSFVSINPAAVISGGVTIETCSLVGASATILQELSIGAHSKVGAGAVVTTSVSADEVVVGIPARVVERPKSVGKL